MTSGHLKVLSARLVTGIQVEWTNGNLGRLKVLSTRLAAINGLGVDTMSTDAQRKISSLPRAPPPFIRINGRQQDKEARHESAE